MSNRPVQLNDSARACARRKICLWLAVQRSSCWPTQLGRLTGEWQGEDGLTLIRALVRLDRHAVIICAGATQRTLIVQGLDATAVSPAWSAGVSAGRTGVGAARHHRPRNRQLTE